MMFSYEYVGYENLSERKLCFSYIFLKCFNVYKKIDINIKFYMHF